MEKRPRSGNGKGAHADVDSLERDIEQIRGNLGGLIGELDHRRHEAFDLRRQLRRHGLFFGLTLLAVVGLATSGILIYRERARRRRALPARLRRLRVAVRRMVAQPERVAEPQPRVGKKILAAGGTAIASVIGRRVAQRIINRPKRRR